MNYSRALAGTAKRKFLFLILTMTAVFFGLSSRVQATPYYYTFDGTIIGSLFDDGAGAIAAAGLAIGDSVTYTFIVDFDTNGTYTLNNGTEKTQTDDASYSYFYTDFVSGDTLSEVDGGFYNGGNNIAEYNSGFDYAPDCSHSTCGSFRGGSYDAQVTIYSNGSDFVGGGSIATNWVVGTMLRATSRAFDSARKKSDFLADMTLTDISPVTPAPEPTTLAILGLGLAGIGFSRRKKLAA